MPDLFYDLYFNKLTELDTQRRINSSTIVKILGNEFRGIWRPLDRHEYREERIVAIDGGVRELELRDGGGFVVARAIAVSNTNRPPVRDLVVKLTPVYSNSLKWALLSAVESQVALRAIEELDGSILLMDGSLYARITALIHELILTKGFLDLYHIPEVGHALELLAQLLRRSRELGVSVVFVSKDSGLRIFKDHMLFTVLKELILSDAPFFNVDKELLDILNRGIDWYSIVWIRSFRRKLLEMAKAYIGPRRDLVRDGIRLILSQSVTDIQLLEQLAETFGINVGVTRRLLVGAVDAYLNSRSLVQLDNLMNLIRDRVEDGVDLRSVDDYYVESVDSQLSRIRTSLEELPRILMMYLKPSRADSPLLVEVPYHDWPMFNPSVPWKLFYDKISVDRELAILMNMYRDPIHYNKLLWLAHQYANFSEAQFLEYVMAAARKLGIRMKRRFGMATSMEISMQ